MMLGKADYLELIPDNATPLNERSAALYSMVQDLIAFGSWLLVLPNFVPISLLVTMESVRFI